MRGPKFAALIGMLITTMTLALLGAVASAEAAAPWKPPATSDACGSLLAKADGTKWACSFVDDFNGTALDRSKWAVQTNTPAGSPTALACHTDSPNNVAVSGGTLRLTVRKIATPVVCGGLPAGYTSGQVSTFWKWSQQYGRFEARMKVPAATTPGLHEAFWLWPDARVTSSAYWPAAGEIDISETYSMYPDLTVPFLHYTSNDNGGPIPGVNTAWNCSSQRGVWNTYTLIWTASRLEVQVNGTTCLVNTSGDAAFRKAYIMVLTQTLGVGDNGYTGTAPLPATTEVDYVKVWK